MVAKIIEYRGYQIFFDIKGEYFYCHITEDNKKNKSLSLCKKEIDSYITENQKFEPFLVEHIQHDGVIELTGIRRDGRFTYKGKDGQVEQFSEYYEKEYIIYDKNNQKYKDKVKDIDKEIEELRKQQRELLKNVTGTPLTEYKKKFTNF